MWSIMENCARSRIDMDEGAKLPEMRVSTALLRALVDVVQRRGVAPERLLGQQAAALYCEPAERSVPLSECQALLTRAAQLTGEPSLGLQCGMYASEASFGLMTPLVSHAATLRDAIALVTQFHTLLVEGARVRLSERAG